MLKADAYGHGAREIAAALSNEPGLLGLAVARLPEAIELRESGNENRILVLNPAFAASGARARERLRAIIDHRLAVCVSSLQDARALAALAPSPAKLEVHLKVDTGMTRSGIDISQIERVLEIVSSVPALVLEGIFSHLSEAEVEGSAVTTEQVRLFRQVRSLSRKLLLATGRPAPIEHLANTAACLHIPESRLDVVRVGGGLYGIDLADLRPSRASAPAAMPAASANPRTRARVRLRPAMSVWSRIVQIRPISKGTRVGYEGTWCAERDTRIGVIPVGYADGYPCVRGGARVLLREAAVPVVGTVSMDQLCVDLGTTGLEPALGEPVCLLGELGGRTIAPVELARWSGGAPYQITCAFSRRLERVFV